MLVLGGLRALIRGFCDSDWAGCRISRRSVGSFILYLGTGPIDWRSKQHPFVSLSTGEAEFITMDAPARAIVALRSFLKDTKIKRIITSFASTLFTDSTVAETIASNQSQSDRTKHIAIKYHFIRELQLMGVIVTDHVDGKVNPADIGTKVLGKKIHEPLSEMAMGRGTLVVSSKRVKTVISDDFA